MKLGLESTIYRTPNLNCPACTGSRLHTDEERKEYHPLAGHGLQGGRWSLPELQREYEENRTRKAEEKRLGQAIVRKLNLDD